MQSYTHSKSRLFLLELVLAIFIFAVSASICAQVFTKAYTVSRDAKSLSQAVRLAENAAAMIDASVKEGSDPFFYLLREYPKSKETDGVFTAWFDKDMAGCGKPDAVYSLEISCSEEETGLQKADITIQRLSDTVTVHQLNKLYHIPNTP